MTTDLAFIAAQTQYMSGNSYPLYEFIKCHGIPDHQADRNFVAAIIAGKIRRTKADKYRERNCLIDIMLNFYRAVTKYERQNGLSLSYPSTAEDAREYIAAHYGLKDGDSVKKLMQRRRHKRKR